MRKISRIIFGVLSLKLKYKRKIKKKKLFNKKLELKSEFHYYQN